LKSNLLQQKDNNLRASRLSPITKPRSIERYADSILVDERRLSQKHNYNLIDGDVYAIKDLKPFEIAKFKNLEAYPYAFEKDEDVLSWACAILTDSPLGLALLKNAIDKEWDISLSDLGTNGFHLNITDKILELDNFNLDAASLGRSSFFRNSLITVLAKALRDIWHEENWGAFEKNYKPEAVLMLERARAADTDAVSVYMGWELRGAGHNEIWRHILGSDDSDMAQVLVNLLERYPTALYNGMALAHIFRQWYADGARVDALDGMSLEHMDFAMRDGVIKFGEKSVSAKDLEMLSTLPDGIVYLKELGETVCRDPFFSGLNDTINQTHLFQIVYDSKVTYVAGIPFRDPILARKFLNAD
jgi:hypothetical protein